MLRVIIHKNHIVSRRAFQPCVAPSGIAPVFREPYQTSIPVALDQKNKARLRSAIINHNDAHGGVAGLCKRIKAALKHVAPPVIGNDDID